MKKMKFHKYILIDEFPHNDDVKLCIFTRPIYPIQHQKRWNKNIKFACSPSAIKSLKRLKIRQAFEIKENNRFLVDGHEIHVNCIEHDGFGSYMLIIQLMGEKEKQILYTGQFTNYRTALINGLSKYVMGNITDIYIDNTLAFSEHTNSLRTACDTVQNYLKKYEGYKVYLDFENLFGYEELLVNLAQRKIKIKLHALQKAVMEYGNNLQHFQFEGEPDLKVFHRPERSNWHLEDYERFFNDDKCVYLKFIATKATTRIESKFKGFHYIVYSPHAPKYTLARLIKLVKPSRIHPLHMPVQIDKVWSNVIPKDIIPISSELKIQTEPELPEIVWNQAIGGVRVNNNTKNGQRGSENLSHPKVQNNQRGQKKGKKERSFLDMSSEEDEYDNEHEYDDVSIESINDEELVLVKNLKDKPKSPPRILNVEPIEISDDEAGPNNDSYVEDSDDDIQTTPRELNSDYNGRRDQLTENQNGTGDDNSTDGNDHHTENDVPSIEKQKNTGAGNQTVESLVNVIPNQTEKENRLNEINNNGKQIEAARAHCNDDNFPSQTTQSNQSNPTRSRMNLKRRNPLSSWHRETKIQKIQYLSETDEESGNDSNEINRLDSSFSSTLSPLHFD